MPNWTINCITTDNPEIIPTFINEGVGFDFNKLIPMPESLNIEDGSITHEAIAYFITERLSIPYTETNLNNLLSNMFDKNWAATVVERLKKRKWNKGYSKKKLYEMGKQYMFNYEHYGCFTWYQWRNKYWNTKWNACETYYDKDNPTEVTFDTAWDAPEPIFEKMCAMFPDSEINFNCEYEEGYVEEYENDNGILVKTNEYRIDEDEEE